MSRRKRLTARKIREAALDKTPFPGDINNELSQTDADYAGYNPYEQQPGWDLPEEGDPAVGDDDREENNLGKIRSAAFKAKCVKATKLAALLLGEKVSDGVIEEQALDFLNLPAKSIDASLRRFMASDSLYRELQKKKAEENDTVDKDEDKKEEVTEAEEKKDEDKDEDKKEEVTEAEEKKDEDEEEEKEEEEEVEDKDEAKEASDVVVDDISDLITSETKESEEMDIELGSEVVDESDALTSSDQKEIEQAFFNDKFIQAEDEDEEEGEDVKEGKKAKRGAKKMGGQPRVASTEAKELESLWGDFDAPTMKEIDSKLFG